jgi:DNA-binding NtrC family response regulator
MIRLALRKAKGNRAEAAERLGIARARLLRRIEMLRIEET